MCGSLVKSYLVSKINANIGMVIEINITLFLWLRRKINFSEYGSWDIYLSLLWDSARNIPRRAWLEREILISVFD